MDLDENTDVLNEVEKLFKKLETLPENVKRAAFNKIQQKLPVQKKSCNKTDPCATEHKKQPGRKRKIKLHEDESNESKETEMQLFPDDIETECLVQDVLTSRGRKAKRISYAYMHEFGKNEEIIEKQRKTCKKENKEIEGANNLMGPMKTIVEPVTNLDSIKKGEDSSNEDSIDNHADESKEIEEIIKDNCLINVLTMDSLNDNYKLLVVPEENSANVEELLNSSFQIKEEPSVRKSDKRLKKKKTVKKGEHTSSRSSSGRYLWKKRKASQKDTLYCQDCNFITSSKSLLAVHSRHHTGIRPYVCQECGKGFHQASGLTVHLKRHRGQRDYACDYCEYKTYTKVDKLRHMTIHTGERNQICQYCGKAFAKDSTLREHVRGIHERPCKHICSECGFTTYRANNLRVHVRMRHRGEYNNHVCPVCGARVKLRNAFLEHMRSHTGEKPYRCEQCDRSFACPARLNVHRKSVHEPRRYPCELCFKAFQTKHHLMRHHVIHTKEKPFTCPFCTYSCNTQGNMSKHVKTVHHMPHFSYKKYKAEQESDTSSNEVNPEWVEKGQKAMEEYLKDLSTKLGRNVTLEELKEKENEKQKRLHEEAEQAKIKRLNRIHAPEHSYHSNVSKMVSSNSKSDVKIDNDADPSTMVLQVAAVVSETLTDEDESTQSQPVHMDLLSGIAKEVPVASNSSHTVQIPSSINSDNSKVIHIQSENALQTTKSERNCEYGALILSSGENGELTEGQIYELVSDRLVSIDSGNGEKIQVMQQKPLTESICDTEEHSDNSLINFVKSRHSNILMEKGMNQAISNTVVVIINTNQT